MTDGWDVFGLAPAFAVSTSGWRFAVSTSSTPPAISPPLAVVAISAARISLKRATHSFFDRVATQAAMHVHRSFLSRVCGYLWRPSWRAWSSASVQFAAFVGGMPALLCLLTPSKDEMWPVSSYVAS